MDNDLVIETKSQVTEPPNYLQRNKNNTYAHRQIDQEETQPAHT